MAPLICAIYSINYILGEDITDILDDDDAEYEEIYI